MLVLLLAILLLQLAALLLLTARIITEVSGLFDLSSSFSWILSVIVLLLFFLVSSFISDMLHLLSPSSGPHLSEYFLVLILFLLAFVAPLLCLAAVVLAFSASSLTMP